jgi:hypothetical protein
MPRILLCRADCEPDDVSVDDFPSMQKLVGGYIETVYIGGGYNVYVNEDGVNERLPNNACGFLGDFFFTKVNPEDGELVSLTDEDVAACRRYYEMYRTRKHAKLGTGVHTFDSMEALQAYSRKIQEVTELDFAASQN